MSQVAVPPETPSRTAAAVDISAIEQQKENIQPLATGRSATQLASLSSQSRSGLGLKLASEHKRFQAQLAAVQFFEAEGHWPEGKDDLSSEEVASMAEDPLDVHHQYARFVIGSYPAGASATSRLVPLLEQSTRLFLTDERYKNDPRYLRLWNLYAQKMDVPEDCYRFLFAKNVGDRLASLYEEYALVLEAAGKRQAAEQIYQLGIARSAAPLDRLKKNFNKFRERMLVAPPLPEPPAATAPPQRSILAGAGVQGVGASAPVAANGAKLFDVFVDAAGDKGKEREGAQWEDLGTVKSRKRENDTEGTIWKGQTAPQTPGAVAGKPASFKLEVFRDAAPPSAPTTPSSKHSESLAGASVEADLLRQNPFKNYSAADVSLSAVDPLASLPPPAPKPKSSSSSKKNKSSSSSTAKKDGEKAAEFRTCDLNAVYPEPGVEYSFEELKCRKSDKYRIEADSWNGWEWYAAWKEETARTGKTSYIIDPATSWPRLHDLATGEPLWEFVPRPVVEAPAPSPVKEAPAPASVPESPVRTVEASPAVRSPSPVRAPSPAPIEAAPSPAPASPAPVEPTPVAAVAESPARSPITTPDAASPVADTGDSYAPLATTPNRSSAHEDYVDPRRQASPTMNTLEAQHLVDNMFAKTLDFGSLTQHGFPSHAEEDDPDTDEEEDDEDEDDNRAAWADLPPSQLDAAMSQMTQECSMAPTQDDPPFVPFSQTASQMDDSMFATQLSQVNEEDEDERIATTSAPQQPLGMGLPGGVEDDENAGVAPMRLFRDAPTSATPATPAFKPVMRAPFGAKPLGGGAFKPALTAAPAAPFAVFSDGGPSEALVEEEEEFEGEDSFDEGDGAAFGDGFAMGRREKGIPSKYAPYVDAMTPITERTLEIGSATRNFGMNGRPSLGSSQGAARRESQFGAPAPVQEEDEEDTSSSEDGGDDRGLVAAFAESAAQVHEDDSSNSSAADDSDEPSTDDDDEPLQMPAPAQQQQRSMMESSEWRESALSESGQFDALVQIRNEAPARSSFGEHSFDRSISTTLPEGYTIEGNQSGMRTDMVIASTSNTQELSTSSGLAPVEAFSPAVIARLLAGIQPPVFAHADAHDRLAQESNQLAALQKTAERREKASKKAAKDRTATLDDVWELTLDGQVFSVYEKLGQGGFGAVFRVAKPASGGADDSFDLDAELDEDEGEKKVAVKVEQPTNVWEWHVMQQLRSRLDQRSLDSVVNAQSLYAYKDASYLFLDMCDQGSLLDAVNKANEVGTAPPTGAASSGLEEVLAVFFTIELLRVIEQFHLKGFIHGDLKIDNCLLRLGEVPGGAKNWSATYDRTGAGGWGNKGLKIIDFGRTIDRSLFAEGQEFFSTFKADENDCPEMRDDQAWTIEPDYYGLATVAYSMLFGGKMETKLVEGRWEINMNFKRYHQGEMWSRLFDTLLNPGLQEERGAERLRVRREEMERWLESNGEKNGKSLRNLLRKMERWAFEQVKR